MSPPITYDGDEVSGITYDGDEISEVTYDGDVVFSATAIPDSGDLHARYDATEISASNGDTVTTWGDLTGNGHDLTATGGPTYQTSVINGNPIVRYDGVDDYHAVTFSALTQPVSIFLVFNYAAPNDGSNHRIYDADNTNTFTFQDVSGSEWRLDSGSTISGSTPDSQNHIASALHDGVSSELYIDGAQNASGDAGADNLNGFRVGGSRFENEYANVDVGEILIYPQYKAGIRAEVESYLSDKWGVAV